MSTIFQNCLKFLLTGVLVLTADIVEETARTNIKAAVTETIPNQISLIPDGAYQFCTLPDPKDWQDGAGVCLIFSKTATFLDGYYGYPHSNSFVCLRGTIADYWLEGEGLIALWDDGYSEFEQPEATLNWGQKDRLFLDQGKVIHQGKSIYDPLRFILFQKARLNMKDLYPYDSPRMTPPDQICDWTLYPQGEGQ